MDSGGGNAIVCFDSPSIPAAIRDPSQATAGQILDSHIGHIQSVTMLDLAEARNRRGLSGAVPQIVPVSSNESALDYVEKIARRFDRSLPTISDAIRGALAKFDDDHVIWESHGVAQVNDAAALGLIDSTNCVLATLAVQYTERGATYLHIDQRLYDRADVMNQAVLLIHEALYSKARTLGQENSRNTRLLVGSAITRDPKMTVRKMTGQLVALGFEKNDFEAYWNAYPAKLTAAIFRDLLKVAYKTVNQERVPILILDSDRSALSFRDDVTYFLRSHGAPDDACPAAEYIDDMENGGKLIDLSTPTPVPSPIAMCLRGLQEFRQRDLDPETAKQTDLYIRQARAYLENVHAHVSGAVGARFEKNWKQSVLTMPFKFSGGCRPRKANDLGLDYGAEIAFLISQIVESAKDDLRDPDKLGVIFPGKSASSIEESFRSTRWDLETSPRNLAGCMNFDLNTAVD